MTDEFEQKCEELQAILRRYKKVVVAYSGGVDSGLVLKVASDILGPGRAIGVTAKSETLTDEEFETAMGLAREQGFNIRTVAYSELDIENYKSNPIDRCFFCKSELFEQLNTVAQEIGAEAILNGDNFDDIGDHRPGMLAAKHFNVVSPLKEARDDQSGRARASRGGLVWRIGTNPRRPVLPRAFRMASRSPRKSSRQSPKARRSCAIWAAAKCACGIMEKSRGSRSAPKISPAFSTPMPGAAFWRESRLSASPT